MKILVTGARGLMGRELSKHYNFIPLSRDDVDLTNFSETRKIIEFINPDIILHLAAYTDVSKAEKNKEECYTINVKATKNLASTGRYLIYMSTEYVFDGDDGNYSEYSIPNPTNFYSLSKLLGEYEASKASNATIIRTLFKPRPYEHDRVPYDMWTSGDYVDVIAKELSKALSIAELGLLPPIINIGTGRKRLFDLAMQTKNVGTIDRNLIKVKLPRDTSLNLDLWNQLKHDTGM